MSTCFACRVPISSHQAREGEGRCRDCDANLHKDGESVLFGDKEDFDLAYLAFA